MAARTHQRHTISSTAAAAAAASSPVDQVNLVNRLCHKACLAIKKVLRQQMRAKHTAPLLQHTSAPFPKGMAHHRQVACTNSIMVNATCKGYQPHETACELAEALDKGP
jgi:hypothetical protein